MSSNLNKMNIALATAEMGFGHLRALYPLEEQFDSKILILGQTDGSGKFEKRLWKSSLTLYESISRFKNFPVLGPIVYSMMNGLLAIPKPSQKIKRVEKSLSYWLLEKFIAMGLCKGLKKRIKNKNYLITSFYAPVIAFSKKEDFTVFCQICDSDLSRVWVAKDSKVNNTQYFSPCTKATERLLNYGIAKEKIHLTGFPFPKELVGGQTQEVAVNNFKNRMQLFDNPYDICQDKPLEIAYVVGGAGAYSEIGIQIANKLKDEIEKGLITLYLVAGMRKDVADNFIAFQNCKFPKTDNLKVITSAKHDDYFKDFNKLLSHIHLLWTKPSELVFYSSLGIPLILTEPLGPQEEANRDWVLENGFGTDQYMSKYTNLWVMNRLNTKEFAKMAQMGWSKGIRTAIYKIPEIITTFESI